MFGESGTTMTNNTEGMKKKTRLALFSAVVIAFCGVTILLCQTFYTTQKTDILANQKERLQLNASSSAETIKLWGMGLEEQASRISDSATFQLYAQDIASMDINEVSKLNDPESAVSPHEDMSYLSEFVPLIRTTLQDFMTYNGLQDARLVSPLGNILLSPQPRPIPMHQDQILTVQEAVKSNKIKYAPVRNTATGMVLDYVAPLMPAQIDAGETKSVAAFLITLPVTGQLSSFLNLSESSGQEIVANILQFNGSDWEVVRPDSIRDLPNDIQIAPEATDIPFGNRISVNGNEQVYSLGVRVSGLEWLVVEEIPSHIVDIQLNRAFNLIYGAGAFLCLSVLLMFALVWWIIIGREQASVAKRFSQLYQVIRKQKHLLDSINISLDVGLIMADVSGKLHVVNRAFANIVGKPEEELQDSNLHQIVPEKVALQIQQAVADVSKSGASKTIELILPLQNEERLFRATLFPFEDKNPDEEDTTAAVITMQDITEFRKNSEKRNKQQMSTIEALVGTIERVDPYLAGHSSLMRQLVEFLAEDMALEGRDKDTLSTAAVLSQIGRIFVPRDLLSKTDKLTPEEQAELARIPEYAFNILNTIDFGSPVPMAVLQMNEKLDGSGGPNHLKDEAIGLHGRVLGVVNAFCAMASPRAFRASLPIDTALDILRKNSTAYDQKIVEHLATVLTSPEGAGAVTARLAEVSKATRM